MYADSEMVAWFRNIGSSRSATDRFGPWFEDTPRVLYSPSSNTGFLWIEPMQRGRAIGVGSASGVVVISFDAPALVSVIVSNYGAVTSIAVADINGDNLEVRTAL